MATDSNQSSLHSHPLPLRVERQYQGSVLDVAEARRFARVTANWWDVDAEAVECVVDEFVRLAVCSDRPAFRVCLSLDGRDVRVRVEGEDPSISVMPARGPASRR